MAFRLHLIDLLLDVAPPASLQVGLDIEPAAAAQSRLSLEWYVGDGASLCSRWAHAGD